MSDYTIERYSERGARGWVVVHVPTGDQWMATFRTKREAQELVAKLKAEPEVWYVSYPTRKALGGIAQVWDHERFLNEQDARAFAATLPKHRVERLALDGARYRSERFTF